MITKTIKFARPKEMTFHGRNGTGYCSGVEISRFGHEADGECMITPVNSRGVLGNCRIGIPAEALKEIGEAFLELAKKAEASA